MTKKEVADLRTKAETLRQGLITLCAFEHAATVRDLMMEVRRANPTHPEAMTCRCPDGKHEGR